MSLSNADNRYMEFRLSQELYALPLLTVKEVIPKPEITSVPNMPAHFDGMINLRGQILGVYNIKKKLQSKPKETLDHMAEVIIIIEYKGMSLGMIVDEVTRVLLVDSKMISYPPIKSDDHHRQFVGSVIQAGKDLVMTLNINELLELDKFNLTAAAA